VTAAHRRKAEQFARSWIAAPPSGGSQ